MLAYSNAYANTYQRAYDDGDDEANDVNCCIKEGFFAPQIMHAIFNYFHSMHLSGRLTSHIYRIIGVLMCVYEYVVCICYVLGPVDSGCADHQTKPLWVYFMLSARYSH